MRSIKLLALLPLMGCGNQEVQEKKVDPVENIELKALREKIDHLTLVYAVIDDSIKAPLTDCNESTDALEKKICQITQSASVEQQAVLKAQLGTYAKNMADLLFGIDCQNTTDPGCPTPTSLQGQLSTYQSATNASISTLQGQVSTLQGQVTTLQSSMTSAQSAITTLQGQVTTLQTQVATINGTLNSGKITSPISLCNSNPSSGPVYETVWMTGDKKKVYGYYKNGTVEGVALAWDADAGGNLRSSDSPNATSVWEQTVINSSKCWFKVTRVNDSGSNKIQICWSNISLNSTNANRTSGSNALRPTGTAPVPDTNISCTSL